VSALLTVFGATAARGGALVLDWVDLEVRTGEVVGVVGPNGAGKTSLLRAALGLMPLQAGTVRLDDADPHRLKPHALASRVAYLPQERRLGWNMPAWRVAALGAASAPPARAAELARRALEKVGLGALAERGVFDMSGGERARVLLARLFVTGAPLFLADEPTAGLDPDAQLLTLELLRAHAAGGGAVVVTLHDLGLAARMCDRLLVLLKGRVAAEGEPAKALAPAVLAEVFALEGQLVDTPSGPVLAARRLAGDAA
jgi:iron complex transport system ATP-binding protein